MEFYKKHKHIINYFIFGAFTTIINVGSYSLCYEIFNVSNTVSNVISWFLAVSFAFVTNKLYVFDSKNLNLKTVLKEGMSFFSCRILTGIFELAAMYLFVDILDFNGPLMKILVNIVVVILNYVASRLFIFKKKED